MEEVGMNKNYFKLNELNSKRELVDILSTRVAKMLEDAITLKGFATIALSGGSTPIQLLNKLSKSSIAWEKVRITLVDERWVDTNSDKSNEKLIRDNLLKNSAKKARFIPLKNGAVKAKLGVVTLDTMLKTFLRELDVVVLGMGLDGHTASFFPHTPELQEVLQTNNLCCATTAILEPKERMTLSKSFLLSTKNLILHIEGKEKKAVFEKVVHSNDALNMPLVSMMQQKNPILEVYYAE
jgi:6-phosphogluconolactonase